MAYKVLKPFVDKSTGKYQALGSLYECKNAKRIEKLANEGYIYAPQKAKSSEENVSED